MISLIAELNIINHSIKYSLAKIKAALSPSNLDIIEEQQKQNEGKILNHFCIISRRNRKTL